MFVLFLKKKKYQIGECSMWNCTKRPSLVEIGRHVKKKTQDWVVNLGPFLSIWE